MSQPPSRPPDSPSARVSAIFDRVAETYEMVGIPWFAPIAQGLVEVVAPAPGERIVDLGCGRGAALLPVAAAVGPSGRVVGVDISVRMIELLDREVAAAGLANVELHVMDASAPELPRGGSDAVLASLVLFFLPQPQPALREWTALLRPGGRLGISTFGDRDDAWKRLDSVFDPYLPPQMLDARTSGATGPFSSDKGVESLFTGAGLVDVVTTHSDVEVAFPDVGAWSTWTRSHGQRAMWDHVPDTEQVAVSTAAAAILDSARGVDGVARLRQEIRYTLGLAPHQRS